MSHITVTMPSCNIYSCNIIHYTLTTYPTHLIPSCPCCSTEAILAIEKYDFTFKGKKKKNHSTFFHTEI